ncbi:MAG: SCO family protein [Reichenbachiella sp.]
MKNGYWVLSLLIMMSCAKKPERMNTVIELPFFTEETFTPEWIEKSDDRYESIHSIADFSFQNQNGDTITSKEVAGKIYIANFFFSICPGVCPKMTNNLHLVQKEFVDNSEVKILSHSVMPWVDSVGRLKTYAKRNDIDAKQWHLLTGDKNTIYKLARQSYFADEGFGKTVTTEEDFLHTEKLILIDKKGRIRGVYNGTLPIEVKRMIEDIHTLLD